MRLTVLSVAYPFAPVSLDAVGGAEQVLAQLDRALVAAGHRSIVVAREGSAVSGALVPTRPIDGPIDADALTLACARHREAIDAALLRWPVDLMHLHGVDFHTCLPAADVPALATLHLPPAWYPAHALHPTRPRTFVHCVSDSQHRACPTSPALLPPIPNGVPVDALAASIPKGDHALALGRIAPEKGFHLAALAARAASVPLVIAGELFPYPAHQRYFVERLQPLIDGDRVRFVGPVGFAEKRRLLTEARCLLAPSLVPETSSLVAQEALACGTPVIAYPLGALVDVVEPGRTGFLVDDVDAMAAAIGRTGDIDPRDCRRAARERFSLEGMIERYLARYEELALMARPAASA
jgi:glycosyltransferase involved in cell wall biosynthesis